MGHKVGRALVYNGREPWINATIDGTQREIGLWWPAELRRRGWLYLAPDDPFFRAWAGIDGRAIAKRDKVLLAWFCDCFYGRWASTTAPAFRSRRFPGPTPTSESHDPSAPRPRSSTGAS
jgi:hypothetical protein